MAKIPTCDGEYCAFPYDDRRCCMYEHDAATCNLPLLACRENEMRLDRSIGCDDHDGCERGPCKVKRHTAKLSKQQAEEIARLNERLRLEGYNYTMLAQRNGALNDRVAQAEASWRSLDAGIAERVQAAVTAERERCAQEILAMKITGQRAGYTADVWDHHCMKIAAALGRMNKEPK